MHRGRVLYMECTRYQVKYVVNYGVKILVVCDRREDKSYFDSLCVNTHVQA